MYSYFLQNFEDIFCSPETWVKYKRFLSVIMRKANEILLESGSRYPELYLKLSEFKQKWRALDLDFTTNNSKERRLVAAKL